MQWGLTMISSHRKKIYDVRVALDTEARVNRVGNLVILNYSFNN